MEVAILIVLVLILLTLIGIRNAIITHNNNNVQGVNNNARQLGILIKQTKGDK